MLNLVPTPLPVIMRPEWAFCHRGVGEMPQSGADGRRFKPSTQSPHCSYSWFASY
jgi:hypothetical protein